ncbi:MAG: NDP-sugar synthase [Thermoleophilaceae bacterium]|nr:NDP-sugar synthase [Thermoleophilaceae bacterium]
MQAVILSGGQGTRLRPLTSTMPKPAVPMVNRPMLWYMIDWLRLHGVEDVVMSMGYKGDGLRSALDAAGHDGVSITYVEEPEPLGTAGAVKFAEQYLDERFLVLNGDTLADYDLSAEIAQHESTGARATLALVPVEDATAYGVVLQDSERRVEAFLEKPKAEDAPPDPRINAGAYVLERDVLEMIPAGENRSFEHDVFPQLVGDGIYAFDADGYWLDLGTPERYVEATRDLLSGKVHSYLDALRDADGNVIPAGTDLTKVELHAPVVLGEGVTVGPGTRLGPNTVIGSGAEIAADCRVERSVVMEESRISAGASVEDSIVGPSVVLGYGASVLDESVIGEGAYIDPGATVGNGARIEAGEGIAA